MLDDRRDASPGVKFKDAELIGIPTIVIVGKGLANGVVEVRDRWAGTSSEISLEDAETQLLKMVGK
jgi:prolyl-tRNA synthetase